MSEREEDIPGKIARLAARTGLGLRICAEVRSYWEALRAGRLVPDRADVKPRGIDRALEYSFVIERVAPGIGRFRLAGTHLCDVLGMEVRGMPLTAFFVTASRPQITEASERLFHDPAIIEATLVSEPFNRLPVFSARMLLVPLRSDLGDINRALGCLVAEGDIRRTPTRFEVTSLTVTPVTRPGDSANRGEPAQPSRVSQQGPKQGFAEEQAAFHPAPRPKSPEARRASFRVVSPDE